MIVHKLGGPNGRIMILTFSFVLSLGAALSSVSPASHFSGSARNAEAWSPECLPVAQAALRIGGEVKAPVLLSRNEPVTPDLFREFGLECPELLPIFELVVDDTGNIRCVRIIHLGPARPSAKLSRLVRQQVQSWKFKPATFRGKPVHALFTVTIHYRCK